MIQLMGWIYFIQIFTLALSGTTLFADSSSPYEIPTPTGMTINSTNTTTEIPLNTESENPIKITEDSSFKTNGESKDGASHAANLKSESVQTLKDHDNHWITGPYYMHTYQNPSFDWITGPKYTNKFVNIFAPMPTKSALDQALDAMPGIDLKPYTGIHSQLSKDTSFEMDTGSMNSQKSQAIPSEKDVKSKDTKKSETSSFGMHTESGFTQDSKNASSVMSAGLNEAEKSETPFSDLNTRMVSAQTSEGSYFKDNTKSEFVEKSETPSVDMNTGSESTQTLEKSFFKDNTGSEFGEKSEISTFEIPEESKNSKKSETSSFNTGSEKSETPSFETNMESKYTEKTEDFPFGVHIESEATEKLEDHYTEDKIISSTMPTTKSAPEPVYRGDMTVTTSTTANLKESIDNSKQMDTSTLPYSTKILYFDEKTDTQKEAENNDADETSHVTVADIVHQSTPSKTLLSEKTNLPTFRESVIPENVTVPYSKTPVVLFSHTNSTFSGKVNKLSVKTSVSQNKSLNQSMISILASEDSSHIRNSRTAFENLEVISNDNQTGNFDFAPTVTEFSETRTRKYNKTSSTFQKTEVNLGNPSNNDNASDNETNVTEAPLNTTEVSLADLGTTHIFDGIFDGLSEDATETDTNSTRNPKRFHESEERYPEGRIRPIHPDPGYANYPQKDIVRPYRPDVPLHKYPYYRPTPDYRTPIIREDKDYTRPSRPDSEYPRVSFKPNYIYSKTSQDDISPLPVSVFATSPSPYKPSFNRPVYHPQSSFGRPYQPDYHRPSSKPTDDYSVTKSSENIDGYTQDADISEYSRSDYDYTRLSEMLSTYTKNYKPDNRPSAPSSDLSKTYGPTYDAEVSMHSKATSPDDLMSAILEMAKVSKPDKNTNRPSSFYPRPGFGNNYQASDASVKPFSVGTITSAKNLTRVEFIKADCFDNHMKVTMRFNGTFSGLVYSSGYASDSSCSYVNGSGRNHYEFYIRLNRCGTLGQQEVAEQRMRSLSRRRQERAQYLVNTVTVQYNPVIEEDIDEHFRVTCEYGYDFWKTVTFPVMSVESSAVKIRTGSPVVFTLPPPQCNMEIRNGFGPSGTRVSGPVNVGDPLTLVIHMKSESTGFDILVKNCYAHNGAQKRLQLIDSNGCVVQEKLVSAFRGVHSPDRSQQITLYSYLKAFRFTGSPALYIECDVHMCHGSCPPQRCYWRHMYKRSANEVSTEPPTTEESVVSESVSLFQALEVRHDEVDSPYLLSAKLPGDTDGMICMKTVGFGALLASLLLLLLATSCAATCMSIRMRKMKKMDGIPDTRHFMEFDRHVPIK